MGRPQGSRNAGYKAKRRALAERVADAMLGQPAQRPSLRDLASCAQVSVSTLRHYFEHREGVVEAAFEVLGGRAQPFLDRAGQPEHHEVGLAVRDFVDGLVDAWDRYAVAALHTLGLTEGLEHAAVGPAYIRLLLEPTLGSAERLLLTLHRSTPLRFPARVAAIALVAPVLSALQHQRALGGAQLRPLSVPAFIEAHVDAFCAGYFAAADGVSMGTTGPSIAD